MLLRNIKYSLKEKTEKWRISETYNKIAINELCDEQRLATGASLLTKGYANNMENATVNIEFPHWD